MLIAASGVGPEVYFSYDILDIGDIFINSTYWYEVSLTNEGSINFSYKLIDGEIRNNEAIKTEVKV